MPFTNFPQGVSSFGVPLAGQGSLYDLPCGEVYFVCNRAGVINGDGRSRDKPFPSIADAVVSINATAGIASGAAFIYVLSGHAENVTGSNLFSGSSVNAATAVVIPAGTRIIGEGWGSNRPTLTFTAAGSTIALAAANCSIENMILQCAQTGSTTTAAALTVTATGALVRQNVFICAGGTASLFTTSISLSSAATFAYVLDNFAYGAAGTGTPTSWLSTAGTAGPGQVFVQRNNVLLTLSATTGGVVDVSANSVTAPANWVVGDNNFANLAANSTVTIKGVAGWTGFRVYNSHGITNATGGAATVPTPGNIFGFQEFGTVSGKVGISDGTTSG